MAGSIARAGKNIPTASPIQPSPISQSKLDDFNTITLLKAGTKCITNNRDVAYDGSEEEREDDVIETEYRNVQFLYHGEKFTCYLWVTDFDDPRITLRKGNPLTLEST